MFFNPYPIPLHEQGGQSDGLLMEAFVLGVSQIDCLLRPAAQGGTSRTKCAREPRPPREQATPRPCAGSEGTAEQRGKTDPRSQNTPGSPRRATRLARAGRGLRSLVGPHANLIHTQYTHHVVRPAAYRVQTLQRAPTSPRAWQARATSLPIQQPRAASPHSHPTDRGDACRSSGMGTSRW